MRRLPGRRPVRPMRCRNAATRRRGVDLDDPVQVAHVDAELQRGGGHDHAVPRLGERLLGPPPLVQRQRGVRQERGDPARPQRRADLLHQLPGVAEHQPLLAPVQRRDHRRGVAHRPHVIQLDVPGRCRASRERSHVGRNHHARTLAAPRSLQPAQQLGRVPDRRRQPDPLDRPSGHPGQPLQHREQMPAPVVAGERVHLVHHDRPQPGEQRLVRDLEADQHGLQRLRRGQQHVRRIAQEPLPRRRPHVAVPDRGPAAQPAGVRVQPGQQVVQQRLERAHVDAPTDRTSAASPSPSAAGTPPPRSCRPPWARAAARRSRPGPARPPPPAASAARSSPAC